MGELGNLLGRWNYLGISVAVILGNLGMPIPEDLVHVTAGYLVSEGRLWLPAVLVVDILSVILGDHLGYWGGRLLGPRMLAPLERVARARLQRVRTAIETYGALAVFGARFTPGVRLTVAAMAGASGLSPLRFVEANTCAAVLHVSLVIGLGYLLGQGLPAHLSRLKGSMNDLLLPMLALALCILFGWLLCRIRLGRRRQQAHLPSRPGLLQFH